MKYDILTVKKVYLLMYIIYHLKKCKIKIIK